MDSWRSEYVVGQSLPVYPKNRSPTRVGTYWDHGVYIFPESLSCWKNKLLSADSALVPKGKNRYTLAASEALFEVPHEKREKSVAFLTVFVVSAFARRFASCRRTAAAAAT